VNKFFLKRLMLIACLVNISMNYAMEEQERRSFDMIERCRRERRGGFQGCKNKKQCGNSGEYLATYSSDGLCGDCEFKKNPTKFVACLFCRKPIARVYTEMKSFSCLQCFPNLVNFVNIFIDNGDGSMPNKGITCWLNKVRLSMDTHVSRGYIAAFKNDKIYGTVFKNKTSGIYLGAMRAANGNIIHAWARTIEIFNEDKNVPMDDEKMYNLFDKYCILGPKTGELVLDTIPDGALTYEEKITQ
jgi:hypothetical protein